jgi:hypothetical protein
MEDSKMKFHESVPRGRRADTCGQTEGETRKIQQVRLDVYSEAPKNTWEIQTIQCSIN